MVSDDVLDAAELPESVIVLGGGAIALEMAHYYEGLGVKTTVIQRFAKYLDERNRKVGLITNDQGAGLVDSAIGKSNQLNGT